MVIQIYKVSVSQYPDLFTGLEKIKGKYHIELEGAKPYSVSIPRRVPYPF